jgi:hypothetical protein
MIRHLSTTFRINNAGRARAAACVLATLLGGTAHAQVGLSLDAGTTGVGGHVSMPLGQQLSARFGAGYLSHKFDGSTSTIDYNIDGKLRSADALLDWFPTAGNGFRLSAGLVYDANQFDVAGKPSAGRYLINGASYAATDVGVLTGAVEYGKIAPYLGIGYGKTPGAARGWGFAADLGGYYQGKGKARLDSVGCKAAALICQAIARDVAVEQAHLADQVSDVPTIYPVLRLSATYKF